MSNITNAGIPVEIHGREYEFSPLNIRDIEWIENFLKQRVISNSLAAIDPETPAADKRMLMELAQDQANKIDITSPSGFEQLLTISGITRMLFRMAKHNHPDLALETVQEWCTDKETLKEILPKLSTLYSSVNLGSSKRGVNPGTTLKKPRIRNRKS